MENLNIVKPPGNLAELQEAAKNEPSRRRGSAALKEFLEKKGIKVKIETITFDEAAKIAGYKDSRGIIGLVSRGVIVGDMSAKTVEKASFNGWMTKKKAPIMQKKPTKKTLGEISASDDDSTIIVTTKGELKEAFRRWLHSQKRVTVEEILEIVK